MRLVSHRVAAALVAMMLAGVTVAGGADDLLKVQERAKYLNDFKALLQHSDPAVRLAAVEQALATDDAALRTMAREVALSSEDERIRTAALRWFLASRNTIPVRVDRLEKPGPGQEYIHGLWHGLVLSGVRILPNDEIRVSNNYFTGGQLTRHGFEMHFRDRNLWTCVLRLSVATPTLLTGSMDCSFDAAQRRTGTSHAAIPVRIEIS